MDQIQAMRVFVRIVDMNSFSRAAELLQLPRATVSNTVKRLEQRLGVRLLLRTTRQVKITAEGEAYYHRCVQLLDALDETDSMFAQQRHQPKGKVRIDMPHSLAREIVIPALANFYRRYPQIEVALSANDTSMDLLHHGIDCVLRAWPSEEENLVSRRIAEIPQLTCASAEYLMRKGSPTSLKDLKDHHMVGYFSLSTGRCEPLEFIVEGKIERVTLAAPLRVSGADAYTAAAHSGFGLIQAATHSLHPWLAQSSLVEVLVDTPPPPMPLYLMYPPGRFLAPRVRVMLDWLAELFAPFNAEPSQISQ
jgi:DNA-binding transcriptional LysR family regulator